MSHRIRFRTCLVSSLLLLPAFASAQVPALNAPTSVEELVPQDVPLEPVAAVLEETVAEAKVAESVEAESNVQAAIDPPVRPADPPREIEGEPVPRGPIHEAFADPLQLNPQPSKTVSRKPPVLIDELQPEINSDQQNMQWIPGYWAWDQQRNDYVWVSGVWRRVPKGRTWRSGEWRESDEGYQWVSGTWLGEAAAETEVLPMPPESLEAGPTSPAPSDDHFWVPGNWKQNDDSYAWRGGFWTKSHDNWVWVPEHYSWTPAGCQYVSGYWDYPWERRGTLYAPCSFSSTDLIGNVCYRPSQVISTDQWLANLWVDPGYNNYCYGDYYDYLNVGYSPWYRYNGYSNRYYDPFYTYYRRTFPLTYGISLYSYFDGLHRHYARNAGLRPPISFHRSRDWKFSRGYASPFGDVNRNYAYRSSYATRDRLSDLYPYRRAGEDLRRSLDRQRSQNDFSNRSSLDRLLGDRNRTDTFRRTERGNRDRLNSPLRGNRDTVRRDFRGEQNRGAADRVRRTLDQQAIQNRNRGDRDSAGARNRSDNMDIMRRALGQQPRANRDQRGLNTGPRNGSPANRANRAAQPLTRTTPSPGVLESRARARAQLLQRPASRPTMNSARPRSNISQSRPRPTVPQSRPRPTINQSRPRPAITQSRPRPAVQSRPQPSVTRAAPRARPSAGFSISGMKGARGANLSRQRAAMVKRMSERKGK